MSKEQFLLQEKRQWKPGQRSLYLDKMTRIKASAIFKGRRRMLKIKTNYKNGYRDQKYRASKTMPETQTYIFGGMWKPAPRLHNKGNKRGHLPRRHNAPNMCSSINRWTNRKTRTNEAWTPHGATLWSAYILHTKQNIVWSACFIYYVM